MNDGSVDQLRANAQHAMASVRSGKFWAGFGRAFNPATGETSVLEAPPGSGLQTMRGAVRGVCGKEPDDLNDLTLGIGGASSLGRGFLDRVDIRFGFF